MPVALSAALPYAREGAGIGRVLGGGSWVRVVVAAAIAVAFCVWLDALPLLAAAAGVALVVGGGRPALARRRHRRRARRLGGARGARRARRRGRGRMTRLALVRHAEPEETAHGRCYGSLDVGLSQAGREHAARLAVELAALDYDAVVASPRTRARETAEPLAAARGLAVTVADDLREIDFGSFEGRTYEEIEQSEPELFRAWMETPTAVRFPGRRELRRPARPRAARARRGARGARVGGRRHARRRHPRRASRAGSSCPTTRSSGSTSRTAASRVVEWVGETPIVRLLNGSLR